MDRVIAPGKITLLGEYGVLEAGPILVAAVDRYIGVTTTSGSTSGVTFSSPSEDIAQLRVGDNAAESRLLLYVQAINSTRGYLESRGRRVDGLDLELDTTGLKHAGQTLGLGSSGASTVAIAGAMFRHAGLSIQGPARQWDLLTIAAHAQSAARGAGTSGSDVVAAAYGGTVVYRRGGNVHRRSFPRDLVWDVVVKKGGLRTGSMLFRVPGDSGGRSTALTKLLREIARSAQRAVDRLDDTAHDFLDALRDFATAVASLGEESGVVTYTPEMRRVAAVAEEHGVVAKPTPTEGDGDIGVLFSADEASLDRAIAAAEDLGFERLPLRVDEAGVRSDDDGATGG